MDKRECFIFEMYKTVICMSENEFNDFRGRLKSKCESEIYTNFILLAIKNRKRLNDS